MKGWCILQELLYKAPSNVEKIIQKEEYGLCYNSVKRNKINFQFYKEDYINLADLIHLLKMNVGGVDCQFTQLYRGQILIIMKMIAVHLLKMHVCEVCHNNLEPKNIWIKIGQNKLMTCFIEKIDFEKVHFVNYKVPMQNEELSYQEDYSQIQVVLDKLLKFIIMKNGKMVLDDSLHKNQQDDQLPELIQEQINLINSKDTLGGFITYLDLYYLNPPQQQQQSWFSLAKSIVVSQKVTQKLDKDFNSNMLAIRYRNANHVCVPIDDLNSEFIQGTEKTALDSFFQISIYNYTYLDKFQQFAKEFEENYKLSSSEFINQKAKKLTEELAKIFEFHIIKHFDDEIKKLEQFEGEVDQVFQSEFKLKIEMKDFINKEEYLDQWKLWVQETIGNDFHTLQNVNFEEAKVKVLKNTKEAYLAEHKRLFLLEIGKLVSELQ